MALITLSDIKKSFSANVVLDGVSFQVEEKDRIGLIGANGTGKTTLLRILAGLDEPDLGGVTRSRQTAAAYQAQDPVFTEENGVLAEALTTFAPLREVEVRDYDMNAMVEDNGVIVTAQVPGIAERTSAFLALASGEAADKFKKILRQAVRDRSGDAPPHQPSSPP